VATVLERLLHTIVQPAVRLSRAGRILAWNPAAEATFGPLVKRQPIAPLLPESMRQSCVDALLSNDHDVVLPCGRMLRINARERLLILDAPQAEAFDEMPLAMLVWDTGGGELASANDLRLIAASREAEQIGPRRPMRQLIGKLRGEVGPITELDDAYMEVARTGERRVVPNLEDGRGNTFSASIFPIRGDRIGVTFASSADVRRAELGYRTIFQHAHDAIVLIDPESETILEANPAAMALYARGPLEGTTIRELSRSYRPGLSERILAQRFLRFETTHVRGDGADLHLDANLTVIDHDGRTVVVGIMRDITAQIEARAALLASEETYRSLVANAPVIIWTIDRNDTTVFVSASCEELTGFTAADTPPGFWLSRVHEDDQARFAAAHAALFARGTAFDVEYRFRRRDDQWVWFHERASRAYESGGTLLADGITVDITARKLAELEVTRREAQLAEAQSIAHIGSMDIDLVSGNVDWSDEMYRIAGLEPKSRPITFALIRELVPAEVIQNLSAELIEQEHVMRRVDGSERIVLSRAKLAADPATGRRRIVGTVQDITARRDAERALQRSERRLQLMVSRLPVLLWSTDAELRINSLTGAGFGQSSERLMDALSLTVRDLFGGADPLEGPELALRGESVTFETIEHGRDVRVHIEPLRDEHGTVTGTVGIAFDRTKEKLAENAHAELLEQLHDAAEEWRETFDSIQAPIVIVGRDVAICRMNASALAHSRFDHYEQALGQPVAGPGETSIWKEVDAIARAAAEHQAGISLQGVDHDGRYWDLLASRSRGGQVIVIATEVTELMRMQDKLRRTERMSEMGALVAGVAHEVRNPLFGISATLDAFEARFGREQFTGYVDALREQVERMSQLMHELLEYGRPLAATLEPSCIAGVVTSAISSTAPLARQRGVTIDSSVPPEVASVKMDRPRMLQVFENLITNAIQHSPVGSTIEVSHMVDGQTVSILVEDRGPGFRDSDFSRIFEPFFTRRRDGTGLGLSLVRRIVEEHNGHVIATNRAGGGASLAVILPVAGAAS